MLTLYISVAGRPLMPENETRSGPACSSVMLVKSAIQSGVIYSVGFRYRESAIGMGLDNRVPDVRRVGDCIPIHETVTPGALGATLDCMAGNRSRSQPIPIIGRPSELVNHWTEGETGVGSAAGYHDLSSLAERLRNGAAPEVYVGTLDEGQDRLEGFAGVEVPE